MKDGAPISIRPSERGIHNPFAKGGIARTTLAGLFALTGAQMFDAGCAVRTLAPGADSPNRPVATEPGVPSLAHGIANTSATEVAAGRPPVKIDAPMAPQVGIAVVEAAAIGTARAGTATVEAEQPKPPGIGGAEPIPTFPPGHPRAGENPAIDAANKKDAQARADATAAAKAGEVAKAPEVVTQEQLVAQIDRIIDKIKNPDPALLEKYKVDPRLLEMDQTIIINGGVPEELKRSSGKEYTPDSLMGMQDKIKDGVDPKELKRFIKLTYDQMSKRGLGDAGEYTMLATDAAKIDPDHEFIGFYADGNQSRVKPEYKDKAAYVGSMVKQKAAFETIKLWYMVKELTH